MLQVAFGMDAQHPDYERYKEEFFVHYESMLDAAHAACLKVLICWSRRLLQRGLRWGVVTNKAQRFTAPITRSMGLFDSASAVISGDTTPHAKPHPEPSAGGRAPDVVAAGALHLCGR